MTEEERTQDAARKQRLALDERAVLAAERQAQALERIADLLTRAATEAGHDAP